MLDLKLREEFLGISMPKTAIELRRTDNTGAAQQDPQEILRITYPTADVQTALRNLSTDRSKYPIVLLGERGRGKSHIMAVMHHAIAHPQAVQQWAQGWSEGKGVTALEGLEIVQGYVPISEPVHNHEYDLLWDLLFDRHPKGELYRGKFQQMGKPYPPRSLLEEMFSDQPTALILDEFQKWFDGLHDEQGSEGVKRRTWAENFIQNLSELAVDRPEILILVVSVLNNNTEAFRQIHRNSPVLIDFSGTTAKQDRQRLVLHRLFENRGTIAADDIKHVCQAYADERFRLRFPHQSDSERASRNDEVYNCWPFAPELLDLLENHILMAAAAQETRDLIKILAQVAKSRADHVPVITPADFLVDDDACGVQSLLTSIADSIEQESLREVAQRNLETMQAAGVNAPHARELVSALWMRTMSPGRQAGGTRQELHLDITRSAPIDDNAFYAELMEIIENSINIHGEEVADGRLRFGLEENPRSKVRAIAKNDRIWANLSQTPVPGQTSYPGQDHEHIRQSLYHIFRPESTEAKSQVIVLGPNWRTNPWSEVEEKDHPDKWSQQPVLVVIPDPVEIDPTGEAKGLGKWLARHVKHRRNTVRFLITSSEGDGLFDDTDLRFLARCSYLCTTAWKDDTKYWSIRKEFDGPLREDFRKRFERFAILRTWNFQNPKECRFEIERHGVTGGEIPNEVEDKILKELFDPEQFASLILQRANDNYLVGDILDELSEPPPPGSGDAIPYLGTIDIYEQILRIAASGHLMLNVNGSWHGRLPDHEDDAQALRYMKSKAWKSGQEMRQVQLGLPGAVGGGTVPGSTPAPPSPPSPGPSPTTGGQPPLPTSPTGGGNGEGTGIAESPGGLPGLPSLPKVQRCSEPTNGLNLIGQFDQWGIDSTQQLQTARIDFRDLSVQQLKQILQRLPSSFKVSMEITYRDGDNEA